MPQGSLEVLLVSAKNLQNADFMLKMDPYAIITCRTQERRSSVQSGKGSNPSWNETFVFNVSDGVSDLRIKIMDRDRLSQDDFVGEAIIRLQPVFKEGSIPPTSHNIVKDEKFSGEIKVGLTFTPRRDREMNFGGWKESSGGH